MSKNEYKIIKDFLDKEDLLFDTLTITIGLVGINDNSDDLSQKYRVGKIEASSEGKNDKFIKIRKFIQELNKEVSNKLNTGFKTSDSVFRYCQVMNFTLIIIEDKEEENGKQFHLLLGIL